MYGNQDKDSMDTLVKNKLMCAARRIPFFPIVLPVFMFIALNGMGPGISGLKEYIQLSTLVIPIVLHVWLVRKYLTKSQSRKKYFLGTALSLTLSPIIIFLGMLILAAYDYLYHFIF